jgi:hypothetical protein
MVLGHSLTSNAVFHFVFPESVQSTRTRDNDPEQAFPQASVSDRLRTHDLGRRIVQSLV